MAKKKKVKKGKECESYCNTVHNACCPDIETNPKKKWLGKRGDGGGFLGLLLLFFSKIYYRNM